MRIINRFILKFLLTLNFLNATPKNDSRLKSLEIIDKAMYEKQINILKSYIQCENRIKESCKTYIKELDYYNNNEDEALTSLCNTIYNKHKIIIYIAKIQDIILDYHQCINYNFKKQKIESMQKLLKQVNSSLQEMNVKLDNDLLKKIEETKSFVNQEETKSQEKMKSLTNQKETKISIKNILYKYILVALFVLILFIIFFIIYYISLIYQIMTSIIMLYILYMMYNYFFK